MLTRGFKFGVALAGVVALLATAAAAADVLADKAVKQAGISMQLPKGWRVDEHGSSRTLLVARAPVRDKDETGEFQTLVTVDSDAATKLDGAAQQGRVAKNFNNYQAVEKPAAVTINGVEGVMFGGTFTLGPVKVRSRQYMVLQNERLYILTFTSLDSRWSTYAAAIEASAATFTITGK